MAEINVITETTGKRIATALENIVDKMPSGTVYEYGVAFEYGASSPTGKRAVRIDGELVVYDTCPDEYKYTPNYGGTVNENPFDSVKNGKSMFSPQVWYDPLGNKFSRWSAFYVGYEYVTYNGVTYYVWWVCESAPSSIYHLPKAFRRSTGKQWKYVDIGCYEGTDATDSATSTSYLASKSNGAKPSGMKTRGAFYNLAKANATIRGIDTTAGTSEEWYGITELSEITEILQPLMAIMTLTKNSQSLYSGICYLSWAEDNLVAVGSTDSINATSGTLAASTSTGVATAGFKVFNIENIYGHVWKSILNLSLDEGVPYIADIEAWTYDATSDPSANTDIFEECSYSVLSTSEVYVVDMGSDAGHTDVVLPITGAGSSTTYYCDYYLVNASGPRNCYFGGSLSDGSFVGLFCWSCGGEPAGAAWSCGARLSHRSL